MTGQPLVSLNSGRLFSARQTISWCFFFCFTVGVPWVPVPLDCHGNLRFRICRIRDETFTQQSRRVGSQRALLFFPTIFEPVVMGKVVENMEE